MVLPGKWAWQALDEKLIKSLGDLTRYLNHNLNKLAFYLSALWDYVTKGAFFNVQAYGAIGDGVADDSAAILAAVAAAQATLFGGRVYFPPGGYFTGQTTIAITRSGIVLEMASMDTYIKYAGAGYAVSFALAGSAQLHNCGMLLPSILCTNPLGGAVYAKSPYGFFIDKFYFENGQGGTTASGITIDGGVSMGAIHTGTGYYATHNRISHGRCNDFLKGVLFKGGTLSGWDITTGSSLEDVFVNGIPLQAGTVGIEFQGSQQCTVSGGNLESLATGVKLTSVPNRVIGICLDHVRFEGNGLNWDIPADAENTVIIAPRGDVDLSIDLASDTVIIDAYSSQIGLLKLNTRAAPAAPKNGQIWYDGVHFYGRVAGVTKQLDN